MKLPNYPIRFILSLFLFTGISCKQSAIKTDGFTSQWPESIERNWLGTDYWSNPLQDWKLKDGRIECQVIGQNRNVHLLTQKLSTSNEAFEMSVEAGFLHKSENAADWIGFEVGAKGEFGDYRDDAVFGRGIPVGITANGVAFIGKGAEAQRSLETPESLDQFTLKVNGIQKDADYSLTLSVLDQNGKEVTTIAKTIKREELTGDLVLVSHFKADENAVRGRIYEPSSWFKNWTVKGSRVEEHPEYVFGPILFSQYTLSKGILKLTAQMAPIGHQDDQSVILEKKENGKWMKVEEAPIDPMARTARFKVENWNDKEDINYRLSYQYIGKAGKKMTDTFEGIIKKDPVDKEKIVVAGFTGNSDLGFPNQDIVHHTIVHQPDLLFFSGDQIYEPVGGFGIVTEPEDLATLDYLRKWYMYGWAYKDMLKNIPSIAIPDDHDVYHGNIWGEGGKATIKEGNAKDRQDSGGYKMGPNWVNMVQRTQTSHFPDPYDATPVKQGIGVYYTDLNIGGISFAVIEDRKFKSSPTNLLPIEAKATNGWAENKSFDVRNKSDIPGAILLGERQEQFLEDWAADWSHQSWMKVLLSQTIFANVATLPKEAVSDVVVPSLRILPEGEYAQNDVIVSDMDSNGWPHTARNKAVSIIRKAFALHYAGDQHLGSTIQYGVDDWKDAGVAVCVPSISNFYPRRWFPPVGGKNRLPDSPKYTGDFLDGFNNHISVYAVSNPVFTGKKPSRLHDRAAGYGIVKLNRKSRNIEIALWPRFEDPSQPNAKPYNGWPITVNQMDNYGRKAVAWLPTIKTTGLELSPVVQVIDDAGEVVYTIRAISDSYSPKVFKNGSYTLRIGEPGTDHWKVLENIQSKKGKDEEEILVEF